MSDPSRGTITGLDIQRGLHEAATPRNWCAREINGVIFIYAGDTPIGMMIGDNARANASLAVETRNVLPEHIRSFENILFRVRYLEGRVKELEAKIEERGKHAERSGKADADA